MNHFTFFTKFDKYSTLEYSFGILFSGYMAKNYHLFKVVENRMQQCCAAHIVHSCQQYCSALLSLNQPAIRCNNAERTILLMTMNNVGSTTLLHPVFNNLEQVIIFRLVYKTKGYSKSRVAGSSQCEFSVNHTQKNISQKIKSLGSGPPQDKE